MTRAALAMVVVILEACAGGGTSAPPPVVPATPEPAAEAPAPAPKRPFTSFEQHEKFGFKDATGAVVIPPKYITVYEFEPGGLARVLDEQGWHVIDETGAVLFEPFLFDNGPDYVVEGLARFVSKGRVGFHDMKGNVVIEPKFDFATPFEGGRAEVCVGCVKRPVGEHHKYEGGKWGIIDRTGAFVVPLH